MESDQSVEMFHMILHMTRIALICSLLVENLNIKINYQKTIIASANNTKIVDENR